MNIEIDTNTFLLGIIACLCAVAISLIWVNHLNERNFIEHGYTRETLPGVSMAQWVKK